VLTIMRAPAVALAAIGWWLIAMAPAAGERIALQDEPVAVTAERPVELTFIVPAGWERVYLSLRGRLFNPAQPGWRGGSMPCIRYEIDRRLLLIPQIVSLHDPTEVPSWGGDFYSWLGESDNWRLTYSPDFAAFVNDSNPAELGDDPYLQVFDLTDLVRRDGPNRLVLRHSMAHFPSFQMIFRDVALLSDYRPPSAATVPRDRPDTEGRVIAPATRHAVDYRAELLPGGAVMVAVGEDRYVVTSRFSVPDEGFRRLGEEPAAWPVSVSGDRLTAQGGPWRLERTLARRAECVEVTDRLTNLSDQPLPVRLAHELTTPAAELERVYMNGRRLPRMAGTTAIDVHPLENPTAYICRERTGIGLLPRDNVFRAHVQLVMRDRAWGLHDRHLALAPGASHELRWEIYPTAAADYYAFVNAARRSLDANYRIDGNMVIAHGFEGNMGGRADEDIVTLVRANNARYIVLSTISRLGEKGDRLPPGDADGYSHGTGLMGEHGRWTRYWLEQVIARFRRLCPEVKLLPYIDPFVCSEPGAAERFADSLALMPDGSPQLYTDAKLPVFYPTQENSYGSALGEAFDWLLSVADGFYMDESTMYYLPGVGAFSYRPDTWDGASCEMDLGSGPDEAGATYRLTRLTTSSALHTRAFRLRQLDRARAQGKAVWMNFQPMSAEEAALQSYRFVEAYASTAPVYGHLGCPVSLANEHVERSEADIGRSIRSKLLFGGLYLTYGVKYETGGNILQDLYPITPLELHCGYVIGREKIVTCTSGTYGFRDRSRLHVRCYDAAGFRLPERDRTVEPGEADTVASVILGDGELAIIFREARPAGG